MVASGLRDAYIESIQEFDQRQLRRLKTAVPVAGEILQQNPKRISIAAVSIAAGLESFYRSAFNAILIGALGKTDSARVSFFPNMQVQIPIRIIYINGFKLIRQSIDEHIGAGALAALLPGVCMAPLSSVLEACNAGQTNIEPLWRRASRGFAPRCMREIIFGLGLNNLTDFFENAVPLSLTTDHFFRNAIGSVSAGCIAGYFSHIPHLMATLKMLHPDISYMQHWRDMAHNAISTRLPPNLPKPFVPVAANLITLFFPVGLVIRTMQIAGSYCILNGITIALITRTK